MSELTFDKIVLEQHGETNVIPFAPRLAVASEDPPGTGKNWLSRMEAGTRFIAKLKHDGGSKLSDFVVMTDPKSMGIVLLGENMQTREGEVRWRDPAIFSDDYKFYLIIEILESKNDSDQIHSGSVASDAQSEIIDSIHEEK